MTVVGYGSQIQVLRAACATAQKELGITCELIDLRTILPWDQETIIEAHNLCLLNDVTCHDVSQSVKKTGRLVVSHEAQLTGGFAAEICSTIQVAAFLSTKSHFIIITCAGQVLPAPGGTDSACVWLGHAFPAGL